VRDECPSGISHSVGSREPRVVGSVLSRRVFLKISIRLLQQRATIAFMLSAIREH